MSPELFIFLINSVIRIGRTTSEAIAQHARDAEALFPAAVKINMKRRHFVSEFFKSDPQYLRLVEGARAPYAEYWTADFHDVKSSDEAVETLYVLAMIARQVRLILSAKDLAESGVHHGLFLLRVDPGQLEASSADRPVGAIIRRIMTNAPGKQHRTARPMRYTKGGDA